MRFGYWQVKKMEKKAARRELAKDMVSEFFIVSGAAFWVVFIFCVTFLVTP